MSDITRVRLPSGEERLVPGPQLEKLINERLKQYGPAILEELRQYKRNQNRNCFLRIARG